METINGMQLRLHQAKEMKEKVKVIFQYPGNERFIFKSGIVLETYEDSFSLDEIKDGHSIYSYNFIVEIRGVK